MESPDDLARNRFESGQGTVEPQDQPPPDDADEWIGVGVAQGIDDRDSTTPPRLHPEEVTRCDGLRVNPEVPGSETVITEDAPCLVPNARHRIYDSRDGLLSAQAISSRFRESMVDDKATQVAARREIVEQGKKYLESLKKRVTSAAIFQWAKEHLGSSRPESFPDDWPKVKGRLTDDLYRLRHPDRFPGRTQEHQRQSPTVPGTAPPVVPQMDERRLRQLEAHSRELAEVFKHPGVLLGGAPFGSSIDPDLVSRAGKHLSTEGAYPEIHDADEELRKKEADRDKLEGKPATGVAAGLSGGYRLVEGEAGDLLLKSVRKVTEKIYPRIREWSGQGAQRSQFTLPTQIATEVWREIESLERGGPGFIKVSKELKDGCWWVRGVGSAYAKLANEEQCRTIELETALKRLARSRGLRSKYREVREADENLSKATATWSGLVRELGKELEYTGLVKGRCGFKFEDWVREPQVARIASERGGTPLP